MRLTSLICQQVCYCQRSRVVRSAVLLSCLKYIWSCHSRCASLPVWFTSLDICYPQIKIRSFRDRLFSVVYILHLRLSSKDSSIANEFLSLRLEGRRGLPSSFKHRAGHHATSIYGRARRCSPTDTAGSLRCSTTWNIWRSISTASACTTASIRRGRASGRDCSESQCTALASAWHELHVRTGAHASAYLQQSFAHLGGQVPRPVSVSAIMGKAVIESSSLYTICCSGFRQFKVSTSLAVQHVINNVLRANGDEEKCKDWAVTEVIEQGSGRWVKVGCSMLM